MAAGDGGRGVRFGRNEPGIEGSLAFIVADHRRAIGVQVSGFQGFAGLDDDDRQVLQDPELGASRLELGDDFIMHVRRTMRSAHVYEAKPPVQLRPEVGAEADRSNAALGITGHFDEAHAAVGGGDLVLDPALLTELVRSPPGEPGGPIRPRTRGRVRSAFSAPSRATQTAAEVPVEMPAGTEE